jgi:hypothetical protein
MSTGLAASTVTPGSTAPDASRTTPTMLAAPMPCAELIRGRNRRARNTPTIAKQGRLISLVLSDVVKAPRV